MLDCSAWYTPAEKRVMLDHAEAGEGYVCDAIHRIKSVLDARILSEDE